MKVTDEMVARAARVRVHTLGLAWLEAERMILEAVLGDVSEPGYQPIAKQYRLELKEAEARIAELEAKLDHQERSQLAMEEHARAQIDRLEARLAHARRHLTDDGWHAKTFDEGRLLDILDGKESGK